MKTPTKRHTVWWSGSAMLIVLVVGMVLSLAQAEPLKPQPPEKKAATKMTGAELYAINCNRCHTERFPTEFTSGQWKTLMMHMRVRANIPAAQADLILKYLLEYKGN